MNDELLEVKCSPELDLDGWPSGGMRVSFYFDHENDNHHTIFERGDDRKTVIARLEAVANLIRRGAP